MESADETRRLLAQEAADPARVRLIATGLKEGMHALDAGCGPGLISETMSELVGPAGRVTGIDMSPERVQESSARAAGKPNVSFAVADVRKTGLPDASFDYVWSQFVFEYLPDPQNGLAELLRVTRPGGKVVVADVDGVGLLNWPFPKEIEEGARKVLNAIAGHGFDIHVGRKMFNLFRAAGLRDVRVQLFTHYIVAGAADARLHEDWAIRFRTLEKVVTPLFGSGEAYLAFAEGYLAMLRDPDALKYSVVLVTEGVKP
jgi:ubiquinone/menaquinone biosynthesis C-methylase UbiE